jgi:hypothetical protein
VPVDASGLKRRKHGIGDDRVVGGLSHRHLVTGAVGVGPGVVGHRWRAGVGGGDRCSDRLDGQHHAQLLVPDDRAPAVEVASEHPEVEYRGLPGREPSGVVAGLEHEVMHVGPVGVLDRDHQPVTDGRLDARGRETHVLGLDRDGGGVPGRDDSVGSRLRRPAHTGRIQRTTEGHRGHDQGEPDDGHAGGLAEGTRCGLAGVSGRRTTTSDRAQQDRDERCQCGQHEGGRDDADQARDRQHADEQAEVGQADAQCTARIEVAVGGPYGGRPAAHDHGNEVGQCAEQDLGHEAGGQVGSVLLEGPADLEPRAGVGYVPRHLRDERQQQADQPHHACGERPRGEGDRGLAPGRSHQGPDHEHDADAVQQQPGRHQKCDVQPGRGDH